MPNAKCFGLVVFLATGIQGRSPQWGSKLPESDFTNALKRVIAAAGERPALESLKGKTVSSRGEWKSMTSLVGADRCWVDQRYIRIPGSEPLSYLSYSCRADYRSRNAALVGFQQLVDLLAKATGWEVVIMINEANKSASAGSPAVKYVHLAGPDDVRLIVVLYENNALLLSCIPKVDREP